MGYVIIPHGILGIFPLGNLPKPSETILVHGKSVQTHWKSHKTHEPSGVFYSLRCYTAVDLFNEQNKWFLYYSKLPTLSVEYSTNHKSPYRNQEFHGGFVTGEHEPELSKGMPNKFHRERFNCFIRR